MAWRGGRSDLILNRQARSQGKGMGRIRNFLRDESGTSSADYSYWIAVISMASIGIVSLAGIISRAEWAVGTGDSL